MVKQTKSLKPEIKPITSAAAYLRVSQTSQAKPDEISLEQQEMKIKEYCQCEGWGLDENHIYKDAGKSGASMDCHPRINMDPYAWFLWTHPKIA